MVDAVATGSVRKRWHHHHRTRFLGASSAYTTSNCSLALPFTLSNGQLRGPKGDYISTNSIMTWETFQTHPTTDSITTTFGLLPNGALYWSHSSFTGGRAIFCQTLAGEIYALLDGPVYPADWTYPDLPGACEPVTLSALSRMLPSSTAVRNISY